MMTQTKTASFAVPHGLPTGAQPRFTASTDDPDSERDRIRQDGLSHRDPLPLLFAHGTRTLPVGMVTGVHRHPHRTEMSFRWLEGDAEAARVKNAYEQGALSASIGFQVEDAVPNELGGLRHSEGARRRGEPGPGAGERARAGAHEVARRGARADEDQLVGVRGGRSPRAPSARSSASSCAPRAGSARAPEPIVFVLDDEAPPVADDLVVVHPEDVKAAMGLALAAVVGREVKAALNRLTGAWTDPMPAKEEDDDDEA